MLGVCINYYNKNYGGLLQALAMTQFLKNNNVEYEIIVYKKKKDIKFIVSSIPRVFNTILLNDKKESLKKKLGELLHSEFKKNNSIRNSAFEKFCKTYFVNFSDTYYGYEELVQNSTKYNVVLSGSDQLWSPAGLPTNFYNLQFCAPSVKRISYASSFGVSYIPWYQKKRTRNYLEKMDCISVRENTGARIINELTGKIVKVVLDPVFLLTKQEWDKLIPEKRSYKEEYIFAYFLGDNQEYRKAVTRFAKAKNLKIVTLRHLDQYVDEDELFGDYAPYDISPSDFLNLIRGASYVFTDSFHGSVFSIIYSKQFMSFYRYASNSSTSKNSRIDTLLENLGLSERRYININDVDNYINYSRVNENLDKLRLDSINYLMSAIKE